MFAERSKHLNVAPYERRENRVGYANGFKDKTVLTLHPERKGRLRRRRPGLRWLTLGLFLRDTHEMTRYRRRSYRYYGHWDNPPSKRDILARQFGSVLQSVEAAFFRLSETSLDSLFIRYGRTYGKSAEAYARKAYPKWKSGTTKLSGKTAERLLELVPRYLTPDERFKLVKSLRDKYFAKASCRIETTPYRWRSDVVPVIEEIVERTKSFRLPEEVMAKATWLSAGDAEKATQLLAAADLEDARLRASYLAAEFKRIEALLGHLPHAETLMHTIDLPQGTIQIEIPTKERGFLARMLGGSNMNDRKGLVPVEELRAALVEQQRKGNLLDVDVEKLSDTQKSAVMERILDERIRLDASQAAAENRFANSTRDMGATIKAVGELEQSSGADYNVTSRFETASGSTEINVKKNNNTVIIVVAIVLGVLALMILG